MNIFKLRTTDTKFFTLSKSEFEQKTALKEPWYNHLADYERHFAVCPACNNSTQILHLYNETQTLHAKHDLGVAVGRQDRQTLQYCPYYSGKSAMTENSRRANEDAVSFEIKRILIDNFDRVIYFIKKTIGIRLSLRGQMARLENYQNSRGWLYTGANLINIPWIFLYQGRAGTLAGQGITNETIRDVLVAWDDDITFDSYNQIVFPAGKYLDINISFLDHRQNIVDETLDESIAMRITGNDGEVIHTERITFNHDYFTRLINSGNHQFRNPEQVALAASILE